MDAISNIDLVIYGIANFLAAILSGVSGAGGGFIMTPLLIFLGASPAQAISTGKIAGFSVSIGSLGGIGKTQQTSRKQLIAIMIIAVVIGLGAPFIITRFDSELYRKVLGFLLLAMIPVLIFKKIGQREFKPSATKQAFGYGLLTVSLALQAIFSGGLGTLVNIVLMAFLGMSALEANVTKRYSSLALNSIIVMGVLFTGLILWKVAVVGFISAGIGGYLGGKLAVKRGNSFVMAVFIILMFVSAIALLFG